MIELGTPLPPDDDYLELTTFLRTKASKVTTFNEQWLRILGSKIFQKLLENIEQELIKLNDDPLFWESMTLYQNFIEVNEINATSSLTHHHPYIPNPPPHHRREIAVSPYKYGSQIFERDVPALEMNNVREKLETKFREAINNLYKQLYDRINPDKKFVDSIRKAIIKVATQEDPQFKIERFNVFLSALVRVVEGQFNKIVRSFDDWFGEFIVGVYDKPLLKSVYSQGSGTVRCKLCWSNPNDLQNYPHLILDKFYQCIRDNLSNSLISGLTSTDVSGLKENCKRTRLSYFEEVKKVNEVKKAVDAFAHKVRNEMTAIRRK